MIPKIENKQPIDKQINIGNNGGNIYVSTPTRWSKRFEKLKTEVDNSIKIDDFVEDLKEYNTLLDGKSMPNKLEDGGFTENEIIAAARNKERYWKKFEKNRFYETAQLIDIEIFALIKFNFTTYVYPLIESNSEKRIIKIELNEKVITPILNILNNEGYEDTILNYSVDDILGMLYFLTGKCHINWARYDNLQSGI